MTFLQHNPLIACQAACHVFAADQTRSFVEENSEDLQRAQVPFKGLVWYGMFDPHVAIVSLLW